MGLLIFIGIAWVIIDIIKEACEPTIPAENWKNSKLIHITHILQINLS